MRGRDGVLPEDVRDLAHDVMAHRLVLSFDALAARVPAREIADRLTAAVPPLIIAPWPPTASWRSGRCSTPPRSCWSASRTSTPPRSPAPSGRPVARGRVVVYSRLGQGAMSSAGSSAATAPHRAPEPQPTGEAKAPEQRRLVTTCRNAQWPGTAASLVTGRSSGAPECGGGPARAFFARLEIGLNQLV
ncbi:hypothetical protein [Nonomuraea maritima]|uniref:hypothetical protein n=1 Tax=Nonomuraea maritima TaxID=683260 RepID=UPI0015A44081|nr:hypothetical protein [Nonomuraea maritima]